MKRLFILTIFCAALFSAGIRIAPATFVVEGVKPGEKIDLYERYGHAIKIWGGATDVLYTFEPVKPSDSNTHITGYFDFRDPSWFDTQLDSVFVPKGTEDPVENRMVVEIPDDDRWYNRHWLLGVNVSPVPTDNMGSVVLGAFLQFRIETEPKVDVEPEIMTRQEIVFVPSVIEFNDVEPGQEYLAKTTIYTGSRKTDTYKLYPLDPESPVGRVTILNAPGYKRLPDKSWLYYEPEVKIPVGGSEEIYFSLFIPEKTDIKRFEELVMIEGETKGFIRIKINMKER